MPHSNQVREFLITSKGIDLVEPYIGPEGVLTGSARVMQEARELTAERERALEKERAARLLERKHALLEQRIAELRAEFAAEEIELLALLRSAAAREGERTESRARMKELRGGRPGSRGNGRSAPPGKILRGKKK
jgi:circadian clock protein KaiC